MIDDRPLRPSREVVFESFNTARRPFGKRLNAAIRTVAHVPYHLMSRRRALRKKTITNSLHFTTYQELSRYSQTQSPSAYLHFTNLPGLPFSNVNVSVSSASSTFNVNVIVLPEIVPAYVASRVRAVSPALIGPPRSAVKVPRN